MKLMRRHVLALGLSAAAALAACGGGGSETAPRQATSSVRVFGDSLADSGAVGYKATVQASDSYVYPELVAQAYGINSLCNIYQFTGSTFVANPTPGCTNHAVSSSRINNPTAPTSPTSILRQLSNAATGTYSASDLVVIDGGGNDAADLFGAYLARSNNSASVLYPGLLASLLPAGDVATAMATPQGRATIGGQYMVALADAFYTSIVTNVLDRGASRVALLNMPAIDKTPRFQLVLSSIAASAGGGTAGATARAQVNAMVTGWIRAFNARLASRFATESRVVIVDFYQAFEDQYANPAQFSLTNVTTPVCPATGVGSDGLPTYTFPTCTAAALSASPPAGVADPNWWRSYAFSDGFHPTPYAHRLIYQLIARSLGQKGWL